MSTEEAFNQMIFTRGIYHKIGLAHGTVASMRHAIKKGKNNISLDKKIELLQRAGYKIAQPMLWLN